MSSIESFSPERTDKPWGYEILIACTDRYVGKILHVNAGHALSVQYHERKDETIYLFSGSARLHYRDSAGSSACADLSPGTGYHIPPGAVHSLEALTDCDFFEASTPELEDVVRLEDRYGRAPAVPASEGETRVR